MAYNTTIFSVSGVDGFIDPNGGHWLYIISGGNYYGFSRDYDENTVLDGPLRKGFGSLAIINNAAKAYAAEHEKADKPRDQYVDKNGMPWIVSHEHNYLTADNWWGATQAYKGAMIYLEGLQGEFEFEIENFALKNKQGGTTQPPKPYTLENPEPAPKDMNDAIQRAYSQAIGLGLSPTEAQATTAIGIFESNLGVSGAFLLPDGTPTYNVGALAANSKAANAFLGAGGRYWQRFPSMHDGVAALVSVPSYAAARAAWQAGDAVRGSAIMFDRGYYEPQGDCDRDTCITNYAKGVVAADQKVSTVIGQKPLLNANSPVPPQTPGTTPKQSVDEGLSTGTTIALAAGFGGILYWFFGRKTD